MAILLNLNREIIPNNETTPGKIMVVKLISLFRQTEGRGIFPEVLLKSATIKGDMLSPSPKI